MGGCALRQSDFKSVRARSVTKEDGPFICPDCFSDAVIKKCADKEDHFAHHHRARVTPIALKSESELHHECKTAICRELQASFPEGNWETERTIPAKPEIGIPELRPDISGRINKKAIAIEVQASTLTVKQILRRTAYYSARKCAVLWVVPLREEFGGELFRPRLMEKIFHRMYYGRVYYWTSGNGANLHAIHFDIATRHIEHKEWYNEYGGLESGGGFDKPYKVIKKPNPYDYDISIVEDFKYEDRDEFALDHEKFLIPRCLIFMDKLKNWWEDF